MSSIAEVPRFYAQARAIMEEHDLPAESFDAVHHKLLMDAFHQEAKPWMDYIAKVHNMALPQYVIIEGKLHKEGDGLSEALRDSAARAQAEIHRLQVAYFGTTL